jgi:hypothetical protein
VDDSDRGRGSGREAVGGRRVRTDCDRMGISAPADAVAISGEVIEGNTGPRRQSAEVCCGRPTLNNGGAENQPSSKSHHSTPSKRNLAIYVTRSKGWNKCTLATKSNGLWSVSDGGRVDGEGLKQSVVGGAEQRSAGLSRSEDWGLIVFARTWRGAPWCDVVLEFAVYSWRVALRLGSPGGFSATS